MPQTSHKHRAARPTRLAASAAFLTACAGGIFASAQPLPDPLPQRQLAFSLDSGLISNSNQDRASTPVLVYSTDVYVPNAAWMRLWFSQALLPGDPAADGAIIRLTSLFDGATQHLDAQSLAWWSNSSAYFNGDRVRVELFAYPNTGPARLAIDRASVGEAPTPYSDRSICFGVDDRRLSNDPRGGRLVTSTSLVCTAWLIDDANRTFFTAGHCTPLPPEIVEFNTPLSNPNGSIVHPPPADQYPIDATSPQSLNGGVGNDFAYFGTLPNTETAMTAYQRQRAFYRLATAAPAQNTGQSIEITGCGSVTSPVSLTWYGVQKTHAGPYAGLNGTIVRYTTDTTGGNSGSPVLDLSTNLAIGIHTHAGCTSAGSSNQGTAIQLGAIQTALASPRGVCLSGRTAPPANPDLYLAGDINNTAGALNATTGAYSTTITQDAGFVRFQGLAADNFGNRFFALANQRLIYPLGSPAQASRPITGTSETLNGLAFDQENRALYAIAQASGQLYRISPSGLATPIGTPRGGRVGALDFDNQRRILFGLDDTTTGAGTRLVRINTADGAQTLVGVLGAGITDCNGLASRGDLFTVDAANRNLYRINPDTGAATLVGATRAMFGASFGMAAFGTAGVDCIADVDGHSDHGVTIDDLLLYLFLFDQGDPAADIDDGSQTATADGGVTIDDLLYYLRRFEDGC